MGAKAMMLREALARWRRAAPARLVAMWKATGLALAPIGQDAHIYLGLLLLGWGLWSSPLPWVAGVVVGLALWYMGVFRL